MEIFNAEGKRIGQIPIGYYNEDLDIHAGTTMILLMQRLL